DIEIVAREPIMLGTYPKEIVTCHRRDGTTFRALCKYAGGATHTAYGHRGGIEYEARVYRELLQRMRTPTPAFVGSVADRGRAGAWLVVEYREGAARVNKVADALPVATRWLRPFHAEAARILAGEPDLPLKRYDAQYYLGWGRRTLEFAGDLHARFPWLRGLCQRFGGAIGRLLETPQTVVHGEFYPANVLVSDGR